MMSPCGGVSVHVMAREGVDEAKASMGLTLEGIRAPNRESETLSRNDYGD